MKTKEILLDLFEKFIFAVTVCTVVIIIVSGKITVEQSAKEIINGAKYTSVKLQNSEKAVELNLGEEKFSFDKSFIEKLKVINREIRLTPFGTFLKSVEDLKK